MPTRSVELRPRMLRAGRGATGRPPRRALAASLVVAAAVLFGHDLRFGGWDVDTGDERILGALQGEWRQGAPRTALKARVREMGAFRVGYQDRIDEIVTYGAALRSARYLVREAGVWLPTEALVVAAADALHAGVSEADVVEVCQSAGPDSLSALSLLYVTYRETGDRDLAMARASPSSDPSPRR